jgi:uncharacterized membrane protein YidH (DUF202 family)
MPKFCPACGIPLQYENAAICPNCGARTALAPEERENIRNPFFAVIYSFLFCGWGQWYNGKTLAGLKFFGAFLVSCVLLYIFSRSGRDVTALSVILSLVIIGIWVVGMYDAYKTADRINRKKESFFRKSWMFWFPVALVALTIVFVIAIFVLGIAGTIIPKMPL